MDTSQDMDIDIQEVTVDTDEGIVFPCKDEASNSVSVLSSDLTPDLLQVSSINSNFRYSSHFYKLFLLF